MMNAPGYAVWLYGSQSRGTADEFSDTDVLFVSGGESVDVNIEDLFDRGTALSISKYSWQEIETMASYGSLFLRHVKLEGRVIFESAAAKGRLKNTLSSLGSYQLASRDVEGFRTVLEDVGTSVGNGEASLIFEMATLGTVFRHASILGCALEGFPCFSRREPVEKLVSAWKLPNRWAREFPKLYGYRLYADGRAPQHYEPSMEFVRVWCMRTRMLVDKLEERVHG